MTYTVFQLTLLGLIHTVLSLVVLLAAVVALVRDGGIEPRTSAGKFYLSTLVATVLTGLPIFRHGTIGPGHVVGVITLVLLGVAALPAVSAAVRTVCHSLTVLLLMIPAVTETLTRVPPGAPLAKSPEAPIFPPLYGALFVAFLIGVTVQLRRLKRAAA